jgi:hypothetical protein
MQLVPSVEIVVKLIKDKSWITKKHSREKAPQYVKNVKNNIVFIKTFEKEVI